MNNPDKSYNIWKAMVIGNSTWSAMVLRNKFERWNDNFVDIKDMEPKELFEYYLSTKEIIKKHKPNNMKIEVHTKEIDPHTEVFALDVDEVSLQRLQYGEVGSPHPYVKVADVTEALKPKAPRSDSDLLDLIDNQGYTYCFFAGEGEVTKSKHRCVAIFSPTGQQLTGVAEGFETVREALGYVLDMEEAG
jgi:hypothetical protein